MRLKGRLLQDVLDADGAEVPGLQQFEQIGSRAPSKGTDKGLDEKKKKRIASKNQTLFLRRKRKAAIPNWNDD